MNKWIKAATLGLVLSTSSVAAHAAQKIGYVVIPAVMQELAKANNVSGKAEAKFKDRVGELQALENRAKPKVEQLARDGELMSATDIEKLQTEIRELEVSFAQKAQALQQDQQRFGAEEEQKMVLALRQAIEKVAAKEGYDVVVDASAVLFADPEHDLSEKVIKAL